MRTAWLWWSSGKDSAWALHVLRARRDLAVTGIVTTMTKTFDRVAMHGVRRTLVEAQALAVGLPLHLVEIPFPCPDEVYASAARALIRRARNAGVALMAFGDLFLEDVRRYRERLLGSSGIEPIFPLWGLPTPALAADMIAEGLVAHLTCVDPRVMPPEYAGRAFDAELLRDLPPRVDPCGENGEFHTLASAGPMFTAPIAVRPGARVERDGFVFADFVLSDRTA